MTGDLEDQVARLQKEVRSLRKAFGKRGAAAYDTSKDAAADFYEEMADRMADAWPAVQNNPGPCVARLPIIRLRLPW